MEIVKDYNLYQKRVLQDFQRVRRFFPFLILTILPSKLPSEIIFTGYILKPEMNSLVSVGVFEKYGLRIKGVYPFAFPEKSVKVYDVDAKISWELLPPEYRHCYSDGSICTHHPDAEINAKPEQDRTIAVLFSAWQLYYQAKLYIEDGKKWVLKDLPHGNQANKVGWIKK
ncbi:MAG: hypothetical protein PHT78_00600 [Desulfitobacteriaceae bacterium]|nr:hypothetical protein [Desulfitobacteriaceae bacterium]MDD4751742.1 hypothetical protein [Desulfitobacteriaceae bacterium]